MSNLPTTSLKFIDIANAYNASGLGNVGTTNLKLSLFAGAVLTDGVIASSGPFNTSMFYGKTFGSFPPSPPTSLSGVSTNFNNFTFSWTETSDWGSGSTASRLYRIRLYKGTAPSTPGTTSQSYIEEYSGVTGSPLTLIGGNIEQGESYWISIRAETNVGESNWVLSPETIVLLPLKIIKIQARQPGEVIPAVRILKTVEAPAAAAGLPGSYDHVPDGSTSGKWDWPDKPQNTPYTMDPYEYITGIEYGTSGSSGGVNYLKIYTFDTSGNGAGTNNGAILSAASAPYSTGTLTLLGSKYVAGSSLPTKHITVITGSNQVVGSGWSDSVPSVLTITTCATLASTFP